MTALLLGAVACSTPDRRGDVVIFASGADLQSINPLLTQHPLARQVQRYVLLTTLARYDSAFTPTPYLARDWSWSPDRRHLTFRLNGDAPWHDGLPTTARDVQWTLDAARDPVTGYPRQSELADLARITAPDDSTVVLDWSTPQDRFPDVLTDLAILPSHLLDTVPHDRLRQAAWNENPVGNGPFRFVRHETNRRWVFERNPGFPADLGGPPRIDRLVIAVVDEPMTKLAALVDGTLDFAGIQPGHAPFVRKQPDLAVIDYPLFFTYVVVLNTRRPPFDQLAARQRFSAAIDRKELVDGYVYGFGTPATDAPSAASTPPAPTTIELLTVGTGDNVLEQMLQAQLSHAGFTVTIRQLELSAFLDRVYGPTHDFTAAVLGVPGDPALGYLGPLGAVAGLTIPRDSAAAQQLFRDSVPVAFLYHARGVQGMNRRVLGVQHGRPRRTGHAQSMAHRTMTGIVRAMAPVRLDLAGAWTDVPPFSTREGGVVVTASIALHARAEASRRASGYLLRASELGAELELDRPDMAVSDPRLVLHAAALRLRPPTSPLVLSTSSDVPPGSGLGSSGALDVAIVAALAALDGESPDRLDVAHDAWRLEAVEAGVPGGKQDQYAAALGGFNAITFNDPDVHATPLRLDPAFSAELARRIVLCYTGASRLSGNTIARVQAAYQSGNQDVTSALFELREVALEMVMALQAADLARVGALLTRNWSSTAASRSRHVHRRDEPARHRNARRRCHRRQGRRIGCRRMHVLSRRHRCRRRACGSHGERRHDPPGAMGQ